MTTLAALPRCDILSGTEVPPRIVSAGGVATTEGPGDRMSDCTTPPRYSTIRVNLACAHGTARRYWAGCRCRLCRAAEAEYLRALRASKPKPQPDDPEVSALRKAAFAEARRRRHRERHPDYTQEGYRREKELHPGRAEVRHRKWRENNRETLAERCRIWAAANPEKVAAKWRNRRAREQNAPGSHTAADVVAQYDRQSGKCYWRDVSLCCAVGLKGGYHVDHVVPLALGGSNGPENLVLACPSCNLHKNASHPMDFAGRML